MKKTLKIYSVDPKEELDVVKSVCRIKVCRYDFKIKNKIVIGTKISNIYEIQEKTSTVQCLINAHSEGELWGLSVHPNKEIFITVSYDCI